MAIIIKEVKTNKEKKQWVVFPNKLYKNNQYYVPFLRVDEMDTFNPKVNPAYDFCETKLFLAYKDNKIVGRIAGLINHAYNKKWNKNAIRFTRFDFIDDYEVSEALFNEVVKWAKENNLTEIMGPIGFTDLDHEGMLVEGYEELNMSITFYNHPYYLTHLERLGLQKDIDWVEFQVKIPEKLDERIYKVTEHLLKRYNYSLVTYTDRKVLVKDAYEAFKLVDTAFSVLYGTVPLTDKIIDKTIKDYTNIVNLDYVCCVKDENNEVIGFALLVPSIAKALKKCDGKITGIFNILKALRGKNDVLEMFLVAVKPELQKRGIPGIMMTHLFKNCIKNKVKYCETGPELETNTSVQGMWKSFETRNHKRRRCFIKSI